MYYHCRPLKYVEYGKIDPPPSDTVDDWMAPAYRWLGHYCGYSPQIWLSRSSSHMTGYRNSNFRKKRERVIQKRSKVKESYDSVLFGFEYIKGFALSYDLWCMILTYLINDNTFEKQNQSIINGLNGIVEMYKEEGEPIDEEEIAEWDRSDKNLEAYLNKYLFKEVDQVVVPSLNLKSAKKIICRNENQKKKLRKMGFIEDRIVIKNMVVPSW